jgi:hypothetical protein
MAKYIDHSTPGNSVKWFRMDHPIGGQNMNKWIEDNIPNTKDAVLVSKWMGHQLDNSILRFLLRDKPIEDLIAFCKELEKESKNNG